MAIRIIFKDDEPILRKTSKAVTKFDENLWELLDDMKETMYKGDGVGLAAVQVGVLKRVVIMEINGMFLELVNPEIISQEGKQENEEGCLSVETVTGVVARPEVISVKAYDRYANSFMITGTSLLAVCLSHELDHLDGVLFTDKAIETFEKGEPR